MNSYTVALRIARSGPPKFGAESLVLQRRVREGGRKHCDRGRPGVSGGSVGPVRCAPGYLPATPAVPPARTTLWAKAHAPLGIPGGRVIWGIFFPQSCCRVNRKAPASRHMVMWWCQPAQSRLVLDTGCGSRTRPGPRRSSQSRPPPADRCAIWSRPRRPRAQGRVLGSVGQVVAGFTAIQVLAIDCPEDFTGLASLGCSDPLGAVTVGAWPLAAFGHRDLPPVIIRHCRGPLHITGPFLGQIPPLVHQRSVPGAHMGQKHSSLTVRDLPQRPVRQRRTAAGQSPHHRPRAIPLESAVAPATTTPPPPTGFPRCAAPGIAPAGPACR